MSRDLKLTAKQAANIGLNDQKVSVTSHINEIRTIQHSLEELQMRLKLRQTSRKKLIDELVHQTRTPLTILSTHLEGLSDGVLQFSPDEMIICESQIENLTAMIRNISNMIDADKDIEQLHIEQIEIRQLLKQITDGLRVQFLNKNVQLKLPDKEKIVLKTDRHKLSQAIYNLLTNAYKFSAPGDQVTIDYQQVADSLTISVKDTGAGIHEEDLNRIFDPYFRGKNAGSITGEGIGLYIAKENVQQLGGQISVQSHPGEGSIFSISLNIAANRPK
jgi:signal transduction histidine kinase